MMGATILRALALALGVATATPAAAHCYKFQNTTSQPRTLTLVGGGNLSATVAPNGFWPERGQYCVYGANVVVRVESGLIDGLAQFPAGDGPMAKPSGTYELK